MKKRMYIVLVSLLSLMMYSCEKQIDEVKVTYRIINFEDGFQVYYKHLSDTLNTEYVPGTYTLATPWMYSFMAEPGDIVYVSMNDTVIDSFSRVQVLLNGKIFKEKIRTTDRFMPVTVSGVIPFD